MTIASRATLKGKFEDGDTPLGSDFTDWLDSFIHVSDSTAQSVASPLTVTTLGATTVSAATMEVKTFIINAEVTATVSAAASAAKYILITSSGATFWMPVFAT